MYRANSPPSALLSPFAPRSRPFRVGSPLGFPKCPAPPKSIASSKVPRPSEIGLAMFFMRHVLGLRKSDLSKSTKGWASPVCRQKSTPASRPQQVDKRLSKSTEGWASRQKVAQVDKRPQQVDLSKHVSVARSDLSKSTKGWASISFHLCSLLPLPFCGVLFYFYFVLLQP